MSEFDENYGILGYNASKRRTLKDSFGGGSDDNAVLTDEDRDYIRGLGNRIAVENNRISRRRNQWENINSSDIEQHLLNNQREAIVPKDTEERRRRVFVTSQRGVNDAIDDYYRETFRPNYKAASSDADVRATDAYRSYASVPGANPYTALGALKREADPIRTLDAAMRMPDDGKLDSIAERYANYAGYDPQTYRKAVLEPAIRERAVNDLVDERVPKSALGYFGRSAWRNSLMGGLNDLAMTGYSGTTGERFIDDAALERYNASRPEQWAGAVGGLMLDAAIFAGIGAGASKLTGGVTNVVKNRMVSQLLSKGASDGLTRQAAEQIVKNRMIKSLGTKMVQSSMTQGLTLGTYDAAHSVVDDLLHSEDVNVENAASSFGKGFATGGALGVVGTPLRAASRGLTGGKRLAASAGVLSAESAVFTASNELSKMAADIEIEPVDLLYDFGESAATLLAMRMLHWRPKGGNEKLNTVGRLKEQFRFTRSEADEIASADVNPDRFMADMERSLDINNVNREMAQERVREDYLKLMSDSELSASTRAKLLYMVENKITSTPPVPVDYKIERSGDNYNFVTIDSEGRTIEKIYCNGTEDVRDVVSAQTGNLRRNRIAQHELSLIRNYDSQNFFRQAGHYARETGTDVDIIADVMYRKANKEPVTTAENEMINNIVTRSSDKGTETTQMFRKIRQDLERKFGLNEGSLVDAVNKSALQCSAKENEALNEYERVLDNEVSKLHNAVSSFSNNGNLNNYYRNRHPQYIEYVGNEARRFANNLGFDVEIITDESEIPSDDVGYRNKRYSTGWFDLHNDRLVINLPNNANISEVKRTIVHEIVGHKGFSALFGNYYRDFLEEVYIKGSDKVRKGIEDYVSRNGGSYQLGADEYLAVLSERTHTTPEQRSIMQRFRDFVKDMLHRFNLYNAPITESELVKLIQRHHSAMLRHENFNDYRASAFRPYETAHRRDGGYYNDEVARKRYNRKMQGNAESNGFAGRFNDYGWNMYDAASDPSQRYRYRYIGEEGVRKLARAGFNFYDRLDDAKAMKNAGYSNSDIRNATGWDIDSNGFWRCKFLEEMPKIEYDDFVQKVITKYVSDNYAKRYKRLLNKPADEITSSEIRFIENMRDLATKNDIEISLSDLVDDFMFFKAYPEAMDIPVVFYPLKSAASVFDADMHRVFVDKSRLISDSEGLRKSLETVMYHIMQQYEGIPFSPMDVSSDVLKEYERAINMVNMLKYLDKDGADGGHDSYYKMFNEMYGMSPENFARKYPTFDAYVNSAEKREQISDPKYQKNVVEKIEHLKKFLQGPLDIIDSKTHY